MKEKRSGGWGERAQELDNAVSPNLPMFYRRAFRCLGKTPDLWKMLFKMLSFPLASIRASLEGKPNFQLG
jgi:hypothetical protein